MIAEYLDIQGLPGTRQQNGSLDMGDSAAIYFNILALSDEPAVSVMKYYSTAPLRHPDANQWWGQSDRFSRDQLIPVLCYGVIKGRNTIVDLVHQSHSKKNLCLAWNTKGNGQINMPDKFPDITGPEIWGLYLRIYKPFGYKFFLPFCDLETLVNAILWRFYQPVTNRVTRNHMLVCIAQRTKPSISSWLADKLNNYEDLVSRWEAHTAAVGEYPTAPLFKEILK